MAAERAYWQHFRTGEVWAVEVEAGRPVRCAGPITPDDADAALLPYLPFSTHDLQVILPEWTLFFRREQCPTCARTILPGASTVDIPMNGRAHLSCALNPPACDTQSVGARRRSESLWQRCGRLRQQSRTLRAASVRVRAHCDALHLLVPPA